MMLFRSWLGLAIMATVAALAVPTGVAAIDRVLGTSEVAESIGPFLLMWIMILGIMGIGANWIFQPVLRR